MNEFPEAHESLQKMLRTAMTEIHRKLAETIEQVNPEWGEEIRASSVESTGLLALLGLNLILQHACDTEINGKNQPMLLHVIEEGGRFIEQLEEHERLQKINEFLRQLLEDDDPADNAHLN